MQAKDRIPLVVILATIFVVLLIGGSLVLEARQLHAKVVSNSPENELIGPREEQNENIQPSDGDVGDRVGIRERSDQPYQERALDPLQALLNLYQNLIFILLGVLALVIGAAYISLRFVSKAAAEELAEEAVSRHVDDSRKFHRRLEQLTDRKIETKIEEFRSQVSNLQEAINAISSTGDEVEVDDLEIDESNGGDK